MKRKHWKRIFITLGSVFLLLCSVLFIHIYSVTRPSVKQDTRARQLARLDLVQNMNGVEIAEMKTLISEMVGVRTVKYTEKEKALIYEFDPEQQSTIQIVDKLNKNGFPVKVFVANTANGAGCPVLDKSSISYRMGKYFQEVIK